jgi:hypothetical protein
MLVSYAENSATGRIVMSVTYGISPDDAEHTVS